MKFRMIKNALLVLIALVLAGCGEMGDVKQGRVVAFDAAAKTVTFIEDSGTDPNRVEKYDALPPVTLRLPTVASEIGPLPAAGLMMRLDRKANRIIMFNPLTGSFERIPFALVNLESGVDAKKGHPSLTGRTFPELNMADSTLTFYFAKQMEIVTVQVPEDALYAFPQAESWKMGDEIRIYFKPKTDPDQILRLMNITQTDIYKR